MKAINVVGGIYVPMVQSEIQISVSTVGLMIHVTILDVTVGRRLMATRTKQPKKTEWVAVFVKFLWQNNE